MYLRDFELWHNLAAKLGKFVQFIKFGSTIRHIRQISVWIWEKLTSVNIPVSSEISLPN